MTIQPIIPPEWLYPPSLKVAADIQRTMATQVIRQDDFANCRYIAGMDVSNNPRDPKQLIYGSMVLLTNDCQQIIEHTDVVLKQRFPYVSGFLGSREAPALIAAYQQLAQKPDIIFVDGHGVSHPRGLGIASHIGVLLDCPTIGIAKSILVGKPAGELGLSAGSQVPLQWHNQTIAMLVRSKARCNPLIISAGHRVSLQTAVQLTQQYLRGYRLPEPTRLAHLAANRFRVENKKRESIEIL